MAVPHPWWKKWLCYVSCEWFSKPVFGKRVCVCAYDILRVKKKVKRELGGKDGGLMFWRLPKTIAFIGLDGSGKTTQAKKLLKLFDSLKIKYTYLHLPSSVPIGKITRHSKVCRGIKESSCKPSKMTSLIRQKFFLLGIAWIYLVHIIPSFLRGRIVISDRWFYDELIHCRYKSMCTFPEIYRKIIPKPTVLFYLQESPETAFKRAKEADINYFQRKKRMYDILAKKESASIIKVSDIAGTGKKVNVIIDAFLKWIR